MRVNAKERAVREVDSLGDEIVDLCAKLVRTPSVNPPGDTRDIASLLREWLGEHGYTAELHEAAPGKVSVVCRVGSGKPSLILNGHIDTVPPGDAERWDFPPFCGELKNGKILGRGATDMKGGVASVSGAFTASAGLVEETGGTLTLMLVADEEVGGRYGTEWLLERGKVSGDACIIGEPSGLKSAIVGEKGLCRIILKARGVPAHSSIPTLGENAIEKVTEVMPVIRRACEVSVETPEELKGVMRESREFLMEMLRGEGVEEGRIERAVTTLNRVTVNFGVIRGGVKVNIVPDECTLHIDIRIPPGTTTKETLKRIKEAVEGRDLELKVTHMSEPNYVTPETDIFKVLRRNAEEILGVRLRPYYMPAASDAKHFRLRGIPAIHYGPGCLTKAHAYNEYVEADDVVKAARVIAATTIEYLSGGA